MATAERVFWETVTVIGFVVLLVAAWLLSGYRAERRLSAAREAQQQELASRAEEHRGELDRLEAEHRAATADHRKAEAMALFRGYAAGLQPAAAARWGRFLGATRDQLIRDPRVVFVHLARPDGYVLTSSDQDLLVRGRFDESADWVLAAETIETREGDAGILELAGPVLEGDAAIAYLWIGYDLGAVADPSR